MLVETVTKVPVIRPQQQGEVVKELIGRVAIVQDVRRGEEVVGNIHHFRQNGKSIWLMMVHCRRSNLSSVSNPCKARTFNLTLIDEVNDFSLHRACRGKVSLLIKEQTA